MDTETLVNPATASSAQPRLNYVKESPKAFAAMLALQAATNACKLEESLLNLVKIRASQLNGCAFCIDMHFRDATAAGESQERLYLLNAWHDTDIYTSRERAALVWTDALTQLSGNPINDETFEEVRNEFSDEELANLTLALVTINGWNRFNVGFRMPPGFKG
jgi:AhpD family alkylhydroperoxidase